MGAAVLFLLTLHVGCDQIPPSQAYLDYMQKVDNLEWGAVYDSFSKKTQGRYDVALRIFVKMGMLPPRGGNAESMYEELYGRALFIVAMAAPPNRDMLPAVGRVIEDAVDGETAIVRIQIEDDVRDVHLVKEPDGWKIEYRLELDFED